VLKGCGFTEGVTLIKLDCVTKVVAHHMTRGAIGVKNGVDDRQNGIIDMSRKLELSCELLIIIWFLETCDVSLTILSSFAFPISTF
jgi:hypothetical protein